LATYSMIFFKYSCAESYFLFSNGNNITIQKTPPWTRHKHAVRVVRSYALGNYSIAIIVIFRFNFWFNNSCTGTSYEEHHYIHYIIFLRCVRSTILHDFRYRTGRHQYRCRLYENMHFGLRLLAGPFTTK